jgi:hypothetical protein
VASTLPDVERPSDLESVFEAIGEQPVLGRAVAAAELVGGEDRPAQGVLRERRPRRPPAGAGDLTVADDQLIAVRKSNTKRRSLRRRCNRRRRTAIGASATGSRN